jgi:hypothetical protein
MLASVEQVISAQLSRTPYQHQNYLMLSDVFRTDPS